MNTVRATFCIDTAHAPRATLLHRTYARQITRRVDPTRRRRPSQARLRAAIVPRDGRLLQFRNLLFDYLGAHRRGAALRLRAEIRGTDYQHRRMASRQPLYAMRRREHGRARLRVPDRRRIVLLGLPARG